MAMNSYAQSDLAALVAEKNVGRDYRRQMIDRQEKRLSSLERERDAALRAVEKFDAKIEEAEESLRLLKTDPETGKPLTAA